MNGISVEQVIAWKEEFDKMVETIRNANVENCKNVYAKFGGFCPYIQRITMDALNKSDYPSGIRENSIYVTFVIDLLEKKVEIHSSGHVWISDEDKELYIRDAYLAMHQMTQICKRNGGKVMRKSKYKTSEDAAKKMIKAFTDIMVEVIDYTGGYPYKKGIKALKTA